MQSVVSLELLSCDTADPTVKISADIPNKGIKDWSAIFHDQTVEKIPGASGSCPTLVKISI